MKKSFVRILLFFLISMILSIRSSSSICQELQFLQKHRLNAIQAIMSFPSYFIENRGQLESQVSYHFQMPNMNAYFAPGEIVYQLIYRKKPAGAENQKLKQEGIERDKKVRVENIRLRFLGAREDLKLQGLEERETRVSFFRGKEEQNWVSGLHPYKKVLYKGLYPQIDLLVYGSEGRIKQEYRVKQGGNVGDIAIQYQGAKHLRVNERGELEIETKKEVLREEAPLSFQIINGQRVKIESEYILDKDNTIRFKVGEYEKKEELVIDPELIYSTYLGGIWEDSVRAITVDGEGNAYVTGLTDSSDFPTIPGSYDTSIGVADVFITKIDASGTSLLYSTFLGGSDQDLSWGIAVDGEGSAYVTGRTASTDFPTTSGAFDTSLDGLTDAFVTKVSPKGTDLEYSTYLGGSHQERAEGIACDGNGDAYVTGRTASSDFPITPDAYSKIFNGPNFDAFITKIDSKGTDLLFSTFLGGSFHDYATAIAIDTEGNVFVTGYTWSSDFPTTPGSFDTTFNGGIHDAFITKMNSKGTDLFYSTYLGGSDEDSGQSIAIDETGAAYIGGYLKSTDFPATPGAYSVSYNGGNYDAFITKINPTGTALRYSTYFGGSGHDVAHEIGVDGNDFAYIVGETSSKDLPTTPFAFDQGYNGAMDGFLTKINTNGTTLLYSTFLGGSDRDRSHALAVDTGGTVFIAGISDYNDFPTTPGSFDTTYNGFIDTVITKMPSTSPMLLTLDGHDFDGNGWSDVSVWRPSNGIWYIRGIGNYAWGHTGDIPVNGDYDGDGTTDLAVWRPPTGRWYVKDMGGLYWGVPGDFPVPGNYNGDVNQTADFAVWRPSNGRWYIRGMGTYAWGQAGDIPIPGDYDGDGATEIAVWRPSNGKWYIRGFGNYDWGVADDIPVPADYDGDGKTDIAVWRPSNGRWYIRDSGGTIWGMSGDIPAPGDYDGDGQADIAVWRPSNGRWYIKDIGGYFWGTADDIPLVR